uniref:Calmodulin n=1 Tax=Alexandrium andersonii TaxID=327968 RepID=A0A7S2FG12_9DINO
MSLLTAWGCIEARSWLSPTRLSEVIEKAKELLAHSRRRSSALRDVGGRAGHRRSVAVDVAPRKSDAANDDKVKRGSVADVNEIVTKEEETVVLVTFIEFLYVLRLVRRAARERRRGRLMEIFGRYDHDHRGVIATKDMIKLLGDIKLTPRTREEQMEMRRLVDEADRNGEGVLAFPQFELLVQSMREHIERLERNEEQSYALELGIALPHFRYLRRIFECNVAQGTRFLLVDNLRKVMTLLQRRYSSEELLSLFHAFSRQDTGCIDFTGFIKMMHAIEIAKTHGQLKT